VSSEGALPISVPSLFSLFAAKRTKLTPLFSYPSALFKKECLPKPFAINLFRALSQNPRGGTPSGPYSFDFRLSTVNRISLCLLPISNRIIFFAHPHSLTPIESYSCKNRGGGRGPWQPAGSLSQNRMRRGTSPSSLSAARITCHYSPNAVQPPPRPPKRRNKQLGVYSLPAGGQNNFPPPTFQKNCRRSGARSTFSPTFAGWE